MSYRDDHAAALARIAALEAELREQEIGARALPTADELRQLRHALETRDAEADRAEDDRDRLAAEVERLEQRISELGPLPAFLTGEIKRLQKDLELNTTDREDELRAQVRRLEGQERALQARLAALEQRFADLGPERTARLLPTLHQRNRGFAPITTGAPAGVACPHCRAEGVDAEFVRDVGVDLATTRDPSWGHPFGYVPVMCPRCMSVGLARTD